MLDWNEYTWAWHYTTAGRAKDFHLLPKIWFRPKSSFTLLFENCNIKILNIDWNDMCISVYGYVHVNDGKKYTKIQLIKRAALKYSWIYTSCLYFQAFVDQSKKAINISSCQQSSDPREIWPKSGLHFRSQPHTILLAQL